MSVGNYVPRSKYQSVNEAVKWTVGLLESLMNHAHEEINVTKRDALDIWILKNEKVINVFAKRLEARLESKVKKQNRLVNRILWKLDQPIGTPLKNIPDQSVALASAVRVILEELDMPQSFITFIESDSEVTSKHFIGKSRWKYHEDATYNSMLQQMGRKNIR